MQFVNEGLLGSVSEFRRQFETPILRGRDADATDDEIKKGNERLLEMGKLVNRCVIRRTNSILSKYLPPKVEQVVCCKLTPLQIEMYKCLVKSKLVKNVLDSDASANSFSSLSSITTVNHLFFMLFANKAQHSSTAHTPAFCLFPVEKVVQSSVAAV